MASTQTLARRDGPIQRVPATGLVLGGIASVQFGAALAATLFVRVGPSGAVLLRLASATIVLAIVSRPRIRGRTRDELLLALVFGLILAAMNLTFYQAIDRIPLGVAVTIEFAGPLIVAVISSKRRLDLIWIALAALGILALMNGDTHSLNTLGVILALIAGCLWGCYILVNSRVGQAFEGGAGLSLAMCVATVAVLPVGVAQAGVHLLEPHVLVIGAAVGMLSSAIPYSCELEALRRMATNVFAVLMSVEPAMAAFAGFVVLGQSLSTREFVGIALVVAASVGVSLKARNAPFAV